MPSAKPQTVLDCCPTSSVSVREANSVNPSVSVLNEIAASAGAAPSTSAGSSSRRCSQQFGYFFVRFRVLVKLRLSIPFTSLLGSFLVFHDEMLWFMFWRLYSIF